MFRCFGVKMYLYIKEGYSRTKETTEELLHQSLQLYCMETGLDFIEKYAVIKRTDRGKPYFDNIPIAFSISHTEDLWACLMREGTQQVGVDIQVERSARYDKIAERYYTSEEQEYVGEQGSAGFFEIWTRKEAFAKYTGEGITRKLSEVSTINPTELVFIDFQVRDNVQGSCCLKEKEELWIRKIL